MRRGWRCGENRKADSVCEGKVSMSSEKRKEKTERKGTDRICPVAGKCGGCQYQGMPYGRQLKKKQAQVEKLLKPFCPVRPITGMGNPYYYRNKVHAVFRRMKNGIVISGVYAEGTHRVIPVTSCLIEDQEADAIINDIRGLVKSFKIKIFNEDTGTGLLRHVLVRRGFSTGEIMVILVLASQVFHSKNNFVRALRQLHPEITTIVVNVNAKKTSMVLGDRNLVIYGKGYIEDVLCGHVFRISPGSFYQVNPVQTEKLYARAIELAELTGKERVIDAYCGIGTIGICAADRAGEVIGVELNRDAVKDAVRNARRNETGNVSFYQGDAGRFMVRMAARGEKADVVFMDPPRSGSDEKFMRSVIKLGPERIVYISCNPETQARDLKFLTAHGYRAREAWPYDCFPFTGHTECVALLTNGKE